MKMILLRLTVINLVLLFSINFFILSCSDSAPLENTTADITNSGNNYNDLSKPAVDYSYPIWGKRNFYNKRGTWEGGSIQLSNGSKFTIERGAMIPPHPKASSYYLTVRADYDSLNNQIIISFTPHGVVFNPPARLDIDWTDLGVDVASLYYIDENGNYILQTPDHIDIIKRKLTLYIDHFSRYAIGYE